jgi:hypothetical protein
MICQLPVPNASDSGVGGSGAGSRDGRFHGDGVHVLESPGQFSAPLAPAADKIGEIARHQPEMAFAGIHRHCGARRNQEQIFEAVCAGSDVSGLYSDNLVSFSLGQFGKLGQGNASMRPWVVTTPTWASVISSSSSSGSMGRVPSGTVSRAFPF